MAYLDYPIPSKEDLTPDYQKRIHDMFLQALKEDSIVRKFELFSENIVAGIPIPDTDYQVALYRIDEAVYLFQKCVVADPVLYVLVSDVKWFGYWKEIESVNILSCLAEQKTETLQKLAEPRKLDANTKAVFQRLVLGVVKYIDKEVFEELIDLTYSDVLPGYKEQLKLWVREVPVTVQMETASPETAPRRSVRKYQRRRRGEAAALVAQYQKDYPSGNMSECHFKTGVARLTIKKYWCDPREGSK